MARTSWGAVSPPASPSRLCFSTLAHQGDPIMEGRLIRANRRPAENITFSRTLFEPSKARVPLLRQRGRGCPAVRERRGGSRGLTDSARGRTPEASAQAAGTFTHHAAATRQRHDLFRRPALPSSLGRFHDLRREPEPLFRIHCPDQL